MKFIYFVPTLAALLGLLLTPESTAAQEECDGDAPREHRIGRYHFETTSRVFQESNTHFYVTCVQNKGEGDLWIDWFVPGPHSFIPPGIALESPRPFTTRETEPFDGCLEYGNRAERIDEHFLGHASDQAAIDEEKSLQCQHWAKQAAAKSETPDEIEELSFPIRIFFPSNGEAPIDSMLVMHGVASLYISGNEFISQFEFGLSKFQGRETGAAEDVVMRPVDHGPAGDLLQAAFLSAYKPQLVRDTPSLPLGWENKVVISAKFESDWALTSTRYGFFDKNNVFVGAVFVPVIAPLPK